MKLRPLVAIEEINEALVVTEQSMDRRYQMRLLEIHPLPPLIS